MGNNQSVPRYVEATFCDDVRAEIGNKFSLMGVYSADLIATRPAPGAPAILPKLCIVISVITPVERPFRSVRVVIERDGVIIAETAEIHYQEAPTIEELNAANPEMAALVPFSRQSVNVNMVLSPFVIETDSTLCAKAIVDETETLPSRTLRIRLVAAAEPAEAPAQGARPVTEAPVPQT